MPYCENCGKEISGSYGSGRFCNDSCRASATNRKRGKRSDETKKKISDSLNKHFILSGHSRKLLSDALSDDVKNSLPEELLQVISDLKLHGLSNSDYIPNRTCVICGKEFTPIIRSYGRLSNSKTCSDECRKKLKSDKSIEVYKKLVKEGRFKGWMSRNIISYPEQFFMKVLDNNDIEYKHNKGFWYDHYTHYFLDFCINKNGKNIDLEIDGKQHEYPDRKESDIKRDEILKLHGFIVYRIKWNEINTEDGKALMKTKIDDFLKFYNDI